MHKTYNTKKTGIEETMRIEQANRDEIANNTRRLEELNTSVINTYKRK